MSDEFDRPETPDDGPPWSPEYQAFDAPDDGPAAESEQPPETPERTPWERRREIGLIEALIDSCRQLLFHPKTFFQALSDRGGFGEPLLFFLIFCVLVSIFAFPADLIASMIEFKISQAVMPQYFNLLRNLQAPPALIELGEEVIQQTPTVMNLVLNQLCCMVANPALWVINLFILSAIYAVVSLLFSGRIDYEMVFRVMAFSEAARASLILNPIPYFRTLLFLIHWIILLTLGFHCVGRMSLGKALLLALLPLFLALGLGCSCWCGLSILISF